MELITILGFHDDCGSNLIFKYLPNNVTFTAATALFDEWLFEPKEPKIVIETEGMPDDDSGAPFVPPHDNHGQQ